MAWKQKHFAGWKIQKAFRCMVDMDYFIAVKIGN